MGKLVPPPVEPLDSRIHFPLGGRRFGSLGQEHLRHIPTRERLRRFERDGFLHIRRALTGDALRRVREAVDRLDDFERQRLDLAPGDMMSRFSAVRFDPAFLELVDYARTLPTVWGVLGWNIQLYISHLVVYPPEGWGGTQCREPVWHQDSGRPVLELERPAPRLSVKVAFWLTDTRDADRGGMELIPGSHRLDAPPARADHPEWDGRVRLAMRPGDVTIFDRRIWHRHGSNTSETVRKSLFLGYSYRWLRPLDYQRMPKKLLKRCDPVLRQLLGDGSTEVGWYQPQPEDAPLRSWLLHRLGTDKPPFPEPEPVPQPIDVPGPPHHAWRQHDPEPDPGLIDVPGPRINAWREHDPSSDAE